MPRRDPPRGPPAVLILAAGRGRRLGPAAPDVPKILLSFGGRTLLERHLDCLSGAGAGPVSLVVGYCAELIEAELDRLSRRQEVGLIRNPDWHEGSAVSLDCGRAVLEGGPVLLMDADVLYDGRLIERLLQGTRPATLLLDRELEPGDEPVKICVDVNGRIVDFAKRPEAEHAFYGESVGFFRFSSEMAASLAGHTRAMVGLDRSLEYEEPIRALIRADASAPPVFGYEDITGLPWTEIDFMDDIAKAERLLPLIDGPLVGDPPVGGSLADRLPA